MSRGFFNESSFRFRTPGYNKPVEFDFSPRIAERWGRKKTDFGSENVLPQTDEMPEIPVQEILHTPNPPPLQEILHSPISTPIAAEHLTDPVSVFLADIDNEE